MWQAPGECRSQKSEKKSAKKVGVGSWLKAAEESVNPQTREKPLGGQAEAISGFARPSQRNGSERA